MKRDKIDETKLRELYELSLLSVNEFAAQLGYSPSSVTRRMDDLNIPRRSRSEANRIAQAEQRVNVPENLLRHLYSERKLSLEQIASLLGVSAFLISRRMKEYGIPMRSHAAATTTYHKKDFSEDLIEKAYLLGFRTGDLWVGRQNKTGSTITISLGTSKQAQIDLFTSLFESYGRVRVGKPDSSGNKTCHALVNDSFAYLLPKPVRIDDWIVDNEPCFWSFLAGYVDAEGDIGIYDNKARLRITSSDQQILLDICEKLNSLQIFVPQLKYHAIKGKVIHGTPRPGKANKDLWELSTNRKATLLTILENLLPFMKHADRKRCALEAIANIQARNTKFSLE